MQAKSGTEHTLLLILDLSTRWEWVVSVTPRPRFTPRYSLDRRLGGLLDTRGYRKKTLPLPGIEP
jgi:hypothetical protein